MGAETKIQWCDHTFNGWIGCEKVSPGCKNCYASVETFARVSASRGLPLWGPGSSRHVTSETNWRKPIAWNRAAMAAGERRRVFCSSLSDVFEDRADLAGPRARLRRLVDATTWLDWLMLTKRPENAQRLWLRAWQDAYPRGEAAPASSDLWSLNVWLGTTCEDQARANERLPHLLQVPARVRFVSYEPALGPVDFARWVFDRGHAIRRAMAGPAALNREQADSVIAHPVDWIIVGGESGPAARPFDVAWMRSTVEQCRAAGVPVFCKQLGAQPVDGSLVDVPAAMGNTRILLAHPKGGDVGEWAEDLRVRQWPEVRP